MLVFMTAPGPAPSPPRSLLEHFNAKEALIRLPTGRGTAWRSGNLVLKPLDMTHRMLNWQARVLTGLVDRDDFRVSPPLQARDGSLCVAGWTCWPYLAGNHPRREWPEVIDAGEAFRAALAQLPRPGFLDDRTDDWAIADRVAWGELPLDAGERDGSIGELARRLAPVDQESQLIHGDLTGNVLLHKHLPPAIIDFSPYWRPPNYASAIIVADALLWHDADASVIDAAGHVADLPQMLLRAMLYRLVTERRVVGPDPRTTDR
jgi:uncharacterized protein (TIGR02569 family)